MPSAMRCSRAARSLMFRLFQVSCDARLAASTARCTIAASASHTMLISCPLTGLILENRRGVSSHWPSTKHRSNGTSAILSPGSFLLFYFLLDKDQRSAARQFGPQRRSGVYSLAFTLSNEEECG